MMSWPPTSSVVSLDRDHIQHQVRHRRASNHGKFFVFKLRSSRINNLNMHVLLAGPVCVQSRWKNVAESIFDPDQCSFIVLEIQDNGTLVERS